MKSLYVIGDSNIYGDEQLNHRDANVAKAILQANRRFNYPSLKTYPYFIPNRKICNISTSGMSIDNMFDVYYQMVLPNLNSRHELLLHLPPIHRDNIYFDRYETNKNLPTLKTHFSKTVFDKWCKEYAGLQPTDRLFDLFVNLFNHETINPSRADQEPYNSVIVKFLENWHWSKYHALNRYKSFIHLVETTSPCKNFYVYHTFSVPEKINTTLFDLLKNVDIDITNKIIDNSWHRNMTEITKKLNIPLYPQAHFHPQVHEEYCNKFVKKHF